MLGLLASRIIAATTTVCPNSTGAPATCETNLPTISANNGNLQIVFNILFGVIGAIAIIVIVIAGLRLAASGGDPQGAARARKTLIYAVVGLVIVILSDVIVGFVIGKL